MGANAGRWRWPIRGRLLPRRRGCFAGSPECRDEIICERRDSTHITPFTDRRGYAQWPSSLVWTWPETRFNQRHPQSDGAGNTRYQTTRAPQQDMAPTDEGRHDGRGCYPRCGPRPEGVEKEDNADPYDIGKRPPRWARWARWASYLVCSFTSVKLCPRVTSLSLIFTINIFLAIQYIKHFYLIPLNIVYDAILFRTCSHNPYVLHDAHSRHTFAVWTRPFANYSEPRPVKDEANHAILERLSSWQAKDCALWENNAIITFQRVQYSEAMCIQYMYIIDFAHAVTVPALTRRRSECFLQYREFETSIDGKVFPVALRYTRRSRSAARCRDIQFPVLSNDKGHGCPGWASSLALHIVTNII